MGANRSEIVLSCSNGKIYHSLTEAERDTGLNLPRLTAIRRLRGTWQQGGYTWRVLGRRYLLIRTDGKNKTTYNTIREAAIANNCSLDTIKFYLKNGKSFYGYSWRWEEQDYRNALKRAG